MGDGQVADRERESRHVIQFTHISLRVFAHRLARLLRPWAMERTGCRRVAYILVLRILRLVERGIPHHTFRLNPI